VRRTDGHRHRADGRVGGTESNTELRQVDIRRPTNSRHPAPIERAKLVPQADPWVDGFPAPGAPFEGGGGGSRSTCQRLYQTIPWRFLQREIDGQLPAEALKLTDAEQSPTRQESAAGYRLQGGDIGVGLLILRESGVRSERYVRLVRSRSSGDRYDRDMAQSRVQRVDAHDDRRAQPEVVEVDVPHFTAEGFRQ